MQENPRARRRRLSHLVRNLQRAEQELQELTAGEVDAVLYAPGQSYLLQSAQEQLRRSMQRVRTILRNISDAVIAIDGNGCVEMLNEQAEELTGWTDAEARGLPLEKVFRALDEVTREPLRELEPPRLSASSAIRPKTRGVLLNRRGEEVFISVSAGAIRDPADVSGTVLVFHDDGQERRAQQMLSQAHAFAASIVDTVQQPLLVLDVALCIVAANRSFYAHFRTTPEQTLQQSVFELGNGQWSSPALGRLLCSITEDQDRFEGLEITHDFEHLGRRTMLLSARRMFEGESFLGYILVGIEDITERKLAEQRAQRINQTHAVLSATNQLIVQERDQQRILESACRILVARGTVRAAWIGLLSPADEQLSLAAHAGRVADAFWSAIEVSCQESSRLGATAAIIEPVVCHDLGEEGPHAAWCRHGLAQGLRSVARLPIRARGRCLGTLNLYCEQRDAFATEELKLLDELATDLGFAIESCCHDREQRETLERLRESEQRIRELADTIEDVFWITDPERKTVLYVSPAYETIWGKTCQSLRDDGASWLDVVHPADRDRVIGLLENRYASGQYDEEYRITVAGGGQRWIREHAFPVRNSAGHVERVVAVARDITERKLLVAQVHQSQKMEAMGALAGGVAHDFNNILAIITGNVELALAESDGNAAMAAYLTGIRAAATRGRNVVQQILAFCQQQPAQRRVIALDPVIQETVAMLRATIPAGVDILVNLAPQTPSVVADPTQMHQVLVNLCTNAWHALGEQPGQIEVTLRCLDLDGMAVAELPGLSPGPHVTLSVSDTGGGMDARTLERIFEPFFTTKASGKGTGLGLSVVHGIVRSHQGVVRATSEPGCGATFTVFLPAVASALEQAPAVHAVPRGHGQHILYLDDEEALVELAARTLGRLGYRVSGFTTPADAIEAVRQGPLQYDLLITDLNMPGASGLEVARQVLSLSPSLPVVLSSGYVTDDLRRQAQQLGIREVLYKPNTVEEYAEAIHRIAVHAPAVS